MNSIEIFEKYAQEYDEWFDVNRFAYQSEVLALKKFIPENSKSLEVGVGTGRFAVPLGIKVGIEPAKRVLKPAGYIIIGMIDKESFLGKLYESKKKESKFYRHANFYPVRQVLDWLEKLDFKYIKTCQTIFKNPKRITAIEPVKEGHGEGGFIVIAAQKEVQT
ncbi:MAG: hypothetical protein Q8N79_04420 [Candidatus Methanoperedens sp.]|nr:hypothetical protein [Candidatus Methanoperedens sp.]